MSPQSTGLSPGAVRNLKSLVGQALLLAAVTTVPQRSRTPLTLAWKQIVEAVEDRHRRNRLSRFARLMSARGIEPADIDDGTMHRFGEELLSKSLVTRPKQAARETTQAWNEAISTTAGSPLRRLTIVNNLRRYALSPDAFPPSFGADLDAYLRQSRGENLFGESAAYPMSPDTVAARRKWIFGLASALVEAGRDPGNIRSLADLVDPGAAQAALRVVWERLGRRKTGYLQNLAQLLVNLGRHWVKLPPNQIEELRGFRRSVRTGKTGMTEGNRRKLVPFADPLNVGRLHRLPDRLMEDAVCRDRGGIQEAVQAQTAVAIAIELKCSLRVRTLVGLDLERHIVRSRPGPGAVVHLVIPPELVKNREPLLLELPASVVHLVDLYCERFRCRLLTHPGSWLFPGRNGPKDRGGLGKQIQETIRKWTGLKVNIHLFRHIAGFLILRENPGELETVRLLLGDRSLETIARSYSGMEQAAAFRHYDEVVCKYLAQGEERHAAD
jgi:integrase